MKKIYLIFLFSFALCAEDFISEFEYGQMLYQSPRGVSCVPCHGETGEGRDIVSYTEDNGTVVMIKGPDIRSSTLTQINDSVKKGNSIMPRYFFTDKEIKTIHAYLEKVNLEETE